MSDLQADTPFDQYSRQYQVAAMVNDLRKKGEAFTILDVGGYKGKTAEFFPEDKVIVVDVFDVEEENYIKGDGKNLPFEDGSFDFVLNFDVLEHIPVEGRHTFVDECTRVSSRAAIFSAPHKTAENEKAEEMLNDMHKDLHKEEHRWLKEHIEYTLPDYDDITKHLHAKGLKTVQLPSNDTMLWVLMQGAIFLNSKFPMGAPQLVELNKYYNEHFPYDGGATEGTTYRLILCATKNQDDATKLSDHFAKKNHPLSLLEELDLVSKIHDYNTTLLTKLTEENQNLRVMHQHEAKRAEELHANSVKLYERIAELEADKAKNPIRKLKRETIKVVHGVTHNQKPKSD